MYLTVWPFFDGDDTNVCCLVFSNMGSLLSVLDFLLATGELPEEEEDVVVVVAAAAFLASINILETSFDASGDLRSSLSDLLFIDTVLLGLVDVVFVVEVPDAVCFLVNVE